MSQTIRITSIEDVTRYLFFDQEYQGKIGRNRSLFVYRGLPDEKFKLITSLQRTCKGRKVQLEPVILANFSKYTEMEGRGIGNSVWRKMILGQHHGLPTRLLDWSRSPLMALHFAMTEANMDLMDQRDCVVWRIDVQKLSALLPEKYQEEMKRAGQKVFTVDMLDNVCSDLREYDADMGSRSMVMMEPPTMDMRIANQYSFFSVVPSEVQIVEDLLDKCEEGVVRFIIDKNLRWEIRDMLDQANINERIVYPGLDGIATWLARHYYVRDITRLKIRTISVADVEADVIVNPTNTKLTKQRGVNRAIYYKAGEAELEKACRKLAPAEVGDLVVTDALALKADRIYHIVGEKWKAEDPEGSESIMRAMYQSVLEKTMEEGLHSIGFPLLGAGFYGCELKKAWMIGLETCLNFQKDHADYPLDITFCVIETAIQLLGESLLESLGGNTETISDDYLHIESTFERLPKN